MCRAARSKTAAPASAPEKERSARMARRDAASSILTGSRLLLPPKSRLRRKDSRLRAGLVLHALLEESRYSRRLFQEDIYIAEVVLPRMLEQDLMRAPTRVGTVC
ncbi:hypothetical protein TPAR_07346 [Tolypocladium paradoxum]|uniref:Uncharacterized protein n=1 Tax=Tolypocladium paradoxum TaxID=94208 RepID=A0A2S4KQH7_9HYPO|nr:hypothetical protein TPAR_07346 [Tolypocladium paradoxum]